MLALILGVSQDSHGTSRPGVKALESRPVHDGVQPQHGACGDRQRARPAPPARELSHPDWLLPLAAFPTMNYRGLHQIGAMAARSIGAPI